MRRLEADVRLGNAALHKHEVVAVAVYSMHRNPAYWQVPITPLHQIKNRFSAGQMLMCLMSAPLATRLLPEECERGNQWCQRY